MKFFTRFIATLVILSISFGVFAEDSFYQQAKVIFFPPLNKQDKRTTIVIWHSFGGKLNATLQSLFREFEQSQDEYKIEDVNKSNYENTLTTAATAYRAKTQPNILLSYEIGSAMMINSGGAIIPLYQLLEMTHTDINTNDFLPAVRGYYSSNGKLEGFPFNSSSAVLFYNKTIFTKAGIANPPRTWQEFETVAAKLKKVGQSCALTVSYPEWILLEEFSAWNNLPFATDNNGFNSMNPKLEFNNPKITAILSEFQKWSKDGSFMYGGRASSATPLFTTGKCAMLMNSSSLIGDFSSIKTFEFGVAQLPFWQATPQDKPQNTIIGGGAFWTFNLPPNTPDKDKIYKGMALFYKFLARPEIQAQWAQATGYIPVTVSAYELLNKQGFYAKSPKSKVALDELNNLPPKPYTTGIRLGNFPLIRQINAGALETIFSSNTSVKQTLDDAVVQDNKLIEQFYQQNRN